MWYLSSIRFWLVSALLFCVSGAFAAEKAVRHVIVITVDGMHKGMVEDPMMPSPFMKKMAAEGTFIRNISGVPPTSTYPSHTTIVTGELPCRHGIYYNRRFAYNSDTVINNWWADSIKAPTIWQKASEAGLVTASLFWPVSTLSRYIDYNVPEFWSLEDVPNHLEYIKPYCTPSGILDELEANACGVLDHTTFYAGNICRDSRTAFMANYIINRYAPSLITIHLITTDYAQHATGKDSQAVREAVASADNAIGLILDNLRITGKDSSAVVIVCGDHGFADYHKVVCPNVWLVGAGLLGEEPGGEWKACFHSGGSTQFLYMKDKNDRKTLDKVIALLESLPEDVRSLFKVVSGDELHRMGGDPDAVLALDPVEGVSGSDSRKGPAVRVKSGGDHGYLSGIDPAACIIYGTGIESGKVVESFPQTGIAPMVLELLGICGQ